MAIAVMAILADIADGIPQGGGSAFSLRDN